MILELLILFISGTPGTGKSTLAEELGQRTSMNCINIGDLAKEGDLYDGFDAEYSCPIIDEDRVIHYAYFNNMKTLPVYYDNCFDSSFSGKKPHVCCIFEINLTILFLSGAIY